MLDYYTNGQAIPCTDINGPDRVNNIKQAGIFVVDGGDGSILRASQLLIENDMTHIPILGINTGHVGFLSNDITKKQVMEFLKNPDESKIENRSVLKIIIENKEFVGFNEVVVQAVKRGQLFDIQLKVDDNNLNYKGDGVIISTPSGSTAYNLSAGGSIVQPNTNVISIAPICPFSLAARPLIISDTSKLTLRTSKKAEINIDGVPVFEDTLYNMTIVKSDIIIKLVKFTSFFEAIHTKLGWNYSIRS